MVPPKKIEGTNLDRPETALESIRRGEILSLGNVVPDAYDGVFVGEIVSYWASSATDVLIDQGEGKESLKVDLIRFNDLLMEL